MKTYTGTLNQSELYNLELRYQPADVLLFDIETTGFSAGNTMLYLIGMCFYSDDSWHYQLLFNDDGRSELAILDTFLHVISSFHTLIHFNGDGFDLRYLKEKYIQYQTLTSGQYFEHAIPSLESLESVDLYKLIKPYRSGLALTDLKLKTVQQALDIPRTDPYSGGELIKIYKTYLKEQSKDLQRMLLQHNYDDILAMIPMLRLLSFESLAAHEFQLITVQEQASCLALTLTFPQSIPLCYKKETVYGSLQISGTCGALFIPLWKGELRYYLKNWKDYYYLPIEDTVMHKSIAAFVDTDYKQKATKENGFLRLTSVFFPCPQGLACRPDKLYKKNSSDSISYAEWKPELSKNIRFWMDYLISSFL